MCVGTKSLTRFYVRIYIFYPAKEVKKELNDFLPDCNFK